MTECEIALRPATPADEPFLCRLYADTRAAEMAQVPWPAEQKQAFLNMQFHAQQGWYATAYSTAEHSIILLDQQPVGRWMVARDADSLSLIDIALLAEHRGRGIGGGLIEGLIAEAKRARVPLRLQVQWTNQQAMRLYRRLGFSIVGTDAMYCRMERRPPGEAVQISSISFRPADAADEDFLFRLYASTRADEMAVVPWSAEQKEAFLRSQFGAQTQHYRTEYPDAQEQIILLAGEPAGRLYLERRPDGFQILDITVAPERRNCGLGTAIIERLRSEGGGQPLSIYVEDFNPSARLFRRLGFSVARKEGFQLLLKSS